MSSIKPCRYFRPSIITPIFCRWWVIPPLGSATLWDPFCCSTMRLNSICPSEGMDSKCPSEGRNPRELENEEDSFE